MAENTQNDSIVEKIRAGVSKILGFSKVPAAKQDNNLSPANAPTTAAPAHPNGTTIHDNRIVGVIIVVFVGFAAVMIYSIMSTPEGSSAQKEQTPQSCTAMADSVVHPRPTTPEPPSPPEPAEEPKKTQLAATVSTTVPVQPQPVLRPNQDYEEIRQRRLQALKQALIADISAPDAHKNIRSLSKTETVNNEINRVQAEITRLRNGGSPTAGSITQPSLASAAPVASPTPSSMVVSGSAVTGNQTNSLTVFNRGRTEALQYVDSPTDPYIIRTGSVIPATLISGINSDLPGQILGQVSQNVYDTPTGKHLLIPQGSRLVGEYSSAVKYGQTRVFAVWQRIVFPDGKAMDLGAMPMSTGVGYSGAKDKVDNHYIRIFGSAILLSGIIAGVEYSQNQQDYSNDRNGYNQQRMGDTMSQALGQTLGQTMAEMIRRNMDIAPTLTIRPGFRMNVMLVKDLKFPASYRAFDWANGGNLIAKQ